MAESKGRSYLNTCGRYVIVALNDGILIRRKSLIILPFSYIPNQRAYILILATCAIVSSVFAIYNSYKFFTNNTTLDGELEPPFSSPEESSSVGISFPFYEEWKSIENVIWGIPALPFQIGRMFENILVQVAEVFFGAFFFVWYRIFFEKMMYTTTSEDDSRSFFNWGPTSATRHGNSGFVNPAAWIAPLAILGVLGIILVSIIFMAKSRSKSRSSQKIEEALPAQPKQTRSVTSAAHSSDPYEAWA